MIILLFECSLKYIVILCLWVLAKRLCMDEIPIEVDREYIKAFILNGQDVIRDIIDTGTEMFEDEDNAMGMML